MKYEWIFLRESVKIEIRIKRLEMPMETLTLTILGTGNAAVTKCYNTCFSIEKGGEHFLVDAGGGNTILARLEQADIPLQRIHTMFVTHKHIDHILGVIWIIRMVCQNMKKGKYEGDLTVYGHEEVIGLIRTMCESLLQKSQSELIGSRVHLMVVDDGTETEVLGHRIQFFDIHSDKANQFGFTFWLNEREKLTCCGDEPYNQWEEPYARGSKWLMHEAFCLYEHAEEFKPYEKHHSTVKDAAQLAEELKVQNLILYHTEDKNLSRRKELYTAEARGYFSGGIYVPDDLERIIL